MICSTMQATQNNCENVTRPLKLCLDMCKCGMGPKTLQYTAWQNCAWKCVIVGWVKRHCNTLSKLCLEMWKCKMDHNILLYTGRIVLGHVEVLVGSKDTEIM